MYSIFKIRVSGSSANLYITVLNMARGKHSAKVSHVIIYNISTSSLTHGVLMANPRNCNFK